MQQIHQFNISYGMNVFTASKMALEVIHFYPKEISRLRTFITTLDYNMHLTFVLTFLYKLRRIKNL